MSLVACDTAFFDRESYIVARALLGALVVRMWQKHKLTGQILDVEAYVAEDNLPARAHKGPLFPQVPLFPDKPGHLFVFTANHHCSVGVTTAEGGMVLLRELYPLEGIAQMRHWRGANCPVGNLAGSPGKLCQALCIGRGLNGEDVAAADAQLHFVYDAEAREPQVLTSRRLGLEQDAGPDLRFYIRKPASGIF